jgi:hypothetical protein
MANKKGGDRRSKFTPEIKEIIIKYVDDECTQILANIAEWVYKNYGVEVSISTIDRALGQFHYTLKRVTLVPERMNCLTTIELRGPYAESYRMLEVENDDKNFIFWMKWGSQLLQSK